MADQGEHLSAASLAPLRGEWKEPLPHSGGGSLLSGDERAAARVGDDQALLDEDVDGAPDRHRRDLVLVFELASDGMRERGGNSPEAMRARSALASWR